MRRALGTGTDSLSRQADRGSQRAKPGVPAAAAGDRQLAARLALAGKLVAGAVAVLAGVAGVAGYLHSKAIDDHQNRLILKTAAIVSMAEFSPPRGYVVRVRVVNDGLLGVTVTGAKLWIDRSLVGQAASLIDLNGSGGQVLPNGV